MKLLEDYVNCKLMKLVLKVLELNSLTHLNMNLTHKLQKIAENKAIIVTIKQ